MRPLPRGIALVVNLLLVLGTLGSPPSARAATSMLPNLKMAHLRDLTITVEQGRRLLRFTTIMLNLGDGPFEARGQRSDTADPTMSIDQRIFNDEGGSAHYPTPAVARYSGDGHDHWHVQDIMTYELWNLETPTSVRRGAKHGFCYFDTTAWSLGLPNAAQSPYYQQAWCGTRDVLSNRTGISVGWGDRYPAHFAFQWIDITGMPAGSYMLRATVDQQNWYREKSNNDNCVWAHISIPAAGSAVTVVSRGSDCGVASVQPVSSFPGGMSIDPPRQLTFAAGTYVGYKFNSVGTVLGTRSYTLIRASGAATSHRAIPPGQSSNWLYITNGVWAGYWIKDTASVNFAP